MIYKTPIPHVTGPITGSTSGDLLFSYGGRLQNTNNGVGEAYFDADFNGTLIAGANAASFSDSSNLSAFLAVSYPGFQAKSDCGFFSQFSTLVDAELLNLFSDQMYIGSYFDSAGSNTGIITTYRSGFGNEGRGTWFCWDAEYAFNTLASEMPMGHCFYIKGDTDTTTKPVFRAQALAGGTPVMRLGTTATGAILEETIQNYVATTNATPTTIHTFAADANTTMYIEAVVVNRRTGGVSGTANDGAAYKRISAWKNIGGTATQIGATSNDFTAEDIPGYDVTFAGSGANVLLQVTGAATTNIAWHMTAKVMKVTS